jgi:hypothetical protein
MNEGYPTFENAVSRFRGFLVAQGWPSQVSWIRPRDARFQRRELVIRPVSPATGERHARGVYTRGVAAQLGVMLEGVCQLGDVTFARVVRPLDEDASSRGLFPNGLKLAVPENPAPARVGSRWMWPSFATASPWPYSGSDVEA